MDTEVIAMILSFSLLINLLVLILRNYFLVVMQQSIITLFSIIIIIKFPIDSPTIKFLTKFVINSYLTIFINFDFIIPNIKPLSKNIMTEIYLSIHPTNPQIAKRSKIMISKNSYPRTSKIIHTSNQVYHHPRRL